MQNLKKNIIDFFAKFLKRKIKTGKNIETDVNVEIIQYREVSWLIGKSGSFSFKGPQFKSW